MLLSEEDTSKVAQVFKSLGDENRLNIVLLLLDGEKCVGEISERLNIKQSATSHNLKTLKNAKILKSKKQGNVIYYSLQDSHVKIIIETSLEHLKCEQKGLLWTRI